MKARGLKGVMMLCGILLWACLPAAAQQSGEEQLPSADPSDQASRFSYFYLEALRQQEQGNYCGAFDLFRHARDINPEAAEVYHQLAGYYIDLKDTTMSRQYFEKAAELSPKNAAYKEKLAQLYISLREYDKATTTYEELYAANGQREDILSLLYRLYATQNRLDKMIETLDKMELVEGSNEQLSFMKIQIYEQQGDKDKVLRELKNLIRKHPNDLNYRVMLGNWLLQDDRPDAALKEYKAVLKEEPDNEMAQISMLDYYRAKGMTKKEEEQLESLLLNKKTEEETRITLMRQAIKQERSGESDSLRILSLFDRVLQMPQDNADMILLKAAYMLLLDMPEDSVNNAYEQALRVEPDNVPARYQLVNNVWIQGDYDRVISLCQPAQQYNPDEMVFYYYQGLAHSKMDQPDEALDVFRKGVSQINSESNAEIVSDFYLIMGDILHEKGLSQEAYAAYDSCLQRKPDNFGCLNNYAYYLSLTGKDLDRAEQMSYKVIKAQPDNGTYLDTYAWILFMQGRYEEAKTYIDQALQNDSTRDVVIVEHAGDIYAMTGDTDRAVELWQEAADRGSDSALLQRKIKQRKYIAE